MELDANNTVDELQQEKSVEELRNEKPLEELQREKISEDQNGKERSSQEPQKEKTIEELRKEKLLLESQNGLDNVLCGRIFILLIYIGHQALTLATDLMQTPYSSSSDPPNDVCCSFGLILVFIYMYFMYRRYYRGLKEISKEHTFYVDMSTKLYGIAFLLIILFWFIGSSGIYLGTMVAVAWTLIVALIIMAAMTLESYPLMSKFAKVIASISVVLMIPIFIVSLVNRWTISHILVSKQFNCYYCEGGNIQSIYPGDLLILRSLFIVAFIINSVAVELANRKLKREYCDPLAMDS